jgi:hypothetical protein
LYDGILSWCNEEGEDFEDNAALKKAKHSGKAYLKINDSFHINDVTGLPTPFELTGDPRWDEGGELYRLYDLGLDRKPSVRSKPHGQTLTHHQTDDDAAEEYEEDQPEFSFSDCPY